MGRVAATVHLCAAGTELFGCDDVVRAQQGRSNAHPEPGPAGDKRGRTTDSDWRRTKRSRVYRSGPVPAENRRDAAERVRTAGARARQHWTVWNHGVFGASAKTRDRVAHGVGRGPD